MEIAADIEKKIAADVEKKIQEDRESVDSSQNLIDNFQCLNRSDYAWGSFLTALRKAPDREKLKFYHDVHKIYFCFFTKLFDHLKDHFKSGRISYSYLKEKESRTSFGFCNTA